MPDYAGAEEAIEARLLELWTITPVVMMNEPIPDLVDPDTQMPIPAWVLCEILESERHTEAFGTPGQSAMLSTGIINLHVFVAAGAGRSLQRQYAEQLGQIFQKKEFYQSPGYAVRTWVPRVLGGDSRSDDGNWYGRTVAIPFEFWHLG